MDAKLFKKSISTQLQARPDVHIGDTVKLHLRIKEGSKERVQIFKGIVIAMKGSGISKTMTVRKISFGIGVERIIPMHAPTLSKIEILKRAKIGRSKLYYMRDQIGKKAMKVGNVDVTYEGDVAEEVEVVVDDNTPIDDTKAEVVIEGLPETPAKVTTIGG